jgi:hypothetical protein
VGYVSENRTIRILEDALKAYLLEGRVPSTGELQNALSEEEAAFGALTRSGLRAVPLPERFTESSASAFQDALEAIDNDREVLLTSLADVNELSLAKLAEWNSRAKGLKVRLDKLLGRVESLVLLESDIAGYAGFVEEGFRSLENIASTTTANIDTSTGEVTLNVDRAEADPGSGGTLIDVREASVSIGLIESGNSRNILKVAGASPRNILSDSLNRWGAEVVSRNPEDFRTSSMSGKPVVLEVKIGLVRKEEVSKVVLLMSDATAGAKNVINLQYSLDGYTWANVPSESPVQSGTGNFIFRFPKTEMQWLKVIVSKVSPDEYRDGSPVYDFGISQVKLYSESFEVGSDGVDLYTETLIPKMAGQLVLFGRASLEVCEEIPPATSIRYFLRAYDGSSYTDWVQVAPLSREADSSKSVVDFSTPSTISSEDLTTRFNSSIDYEALDIMRVDGTGSLAYRFNGPNDTIANFYLSHNDNLLSNLVFLRNIGYSDGKYPTVDVDLKVGDTECGWGLDGENIYYCEFQVKNPAGMEIDFGTTQANLDSKVVSGVVEGIKPGWHKFRTTRSNWASLDSTLFVAAPTTEALLKAGDPLYPYNHKYLIEGYNYPTSFIGKKVYKGVDLYTQLRATRVGINTILESVVDASIYAIDVIDGPKTIVLLKFDSSRPNFQNERVRLLYDRRFEAFTGLELRASLKSDDAMLTPTLSYFRVRVQ